MRAIKFRAWDKQNKRMMVFDKDWLCDEYQSLAWSINDQSKLENEGDYSLDCSRDLEIMQFTGLLDKNGIEIYEGDVIEIFNICNKAEGLWEVHWTTDRWYLKRNEDTYNNGDYYHGYDIMWDVYDHKNNVGGVIIRGNIYQNPELLKPMEGK